MILNIPLFLLFNNFIAASSWQQFHRLFSPKTIPHRFITEEQDEDDEDEITIVRRPVQPLYYPQTQPIYYLEPPQQQQAQQPYYYNWQQSPGQIPYQRPPPKQVEHRIYSTKIIDECQPQQQYSYYKQQPQMQQQQLPPINLYMAGETRQMPIPSEGYSASTVSTSPPVYSQQSLYQSPYYGGEEIVTIEERERQFHHEGQQALRHMEKMFDEMGRTASQSDREAYAKKKGEILKQFHTMFDQFYTQYGIAIRTRGRQ